MQIILFTAFYIYLFIHFLVLVGIYVFTNKTTTILNHRQWPVYSNIIHKHMINDKHVTSKTFKSQKMTLLKWFISESKTHHSPIYKQMTLLNQFFIESKTYSITNAVQIHKQMTLGNCNYILSNLFV